MADLPEVFKGENLPEKVEDLAKYVLIAPEVFRAQQAEIRAMQKVGVAKEIMEIKAQDLQRAGQMYMDAEVRLGRITKSMEKSKANQYEVQSPQCGQSKTERLKELGLSRQRTSEIEKMASYPECVELEKKQAEAENRLPSNRNVLRLISGSEEKPTVKEVKNVIDIEIEEAEEIIEECRIQPFVDALELLRFFDVREITPMLMENYGYKLDGVISEVTKMLFQVQIRASDLKLTMEEK